MVSQNDQAHLDPKGIEAPSSKSLTVEIRVDARTIKEPTTSSGQDSFQQFFQNVNWNKTSIGPKTDWPPELRQTVRFIMADTSPAVLYWGESHSIIYNEAYIPLVGDKHPGMMGMNAADVFPEFWSHFAEVISEQRHTFKTASGQASMLPIERDGFLEETYFDWKLIPIIADDGEVKGSYGVASETTRDFISQRQNDCLQQLTHHTGASDTLEELWQKIITGLDSNEKDLPLALLYILDEPIGLDARPSRPSYHCHLEGSTGVKAGHTIIKNDINPRDDKEGFGPAMMEALESGTPLTLEADDPQVKDLLDGIPWRGYELPSKQFVVLPVPHDGSVAAFLVLGLNPYRRYHSLYKEFLQAVAEILSTQIERVRLAEEVNRHDKLARRAKLDFQRSESRFSRFAERSIAGLAMTDTDGKILYANDAWYNFSGIDPSEACNLTWVDSVISDDVDLLHEWQDRIRGRKKGGTFQIRSRQPFRQGHMYSEHRTGICACYSDLSEAGEVESFMILILDISELKWTEGELREHTKKLEESEGKYRNYAEHCPLGICRTDREGFVQYGNDAWHAFYDFTRGQVKDPQPWLPFLHEDDVQPCIDFFTRLQSDAGPEAVELKLKHKTVTVSEGDRTITNDAYVLATGFTEFNEDGTVDCIDFWVTDISAQKMTAKILTEKMEEAIRLKTHQERFIDMISHEIRNPLSAVLHCGEEVVEAMKKGSSALETVPVDLLSPGISTDLRNTLRKQINSALDAANTIMYCVQHQKQIVDDVLTLSKLDSDLLVVSPVPVQPVPLVLSSLKIFEPEIKATGISLSIVKDESLNWLAVDWVLLDPNRFLQIVINLVTNAIKATKASEAGQITVTVAALTDRPSEGYQGVDYVPRRHSAYIPDSPVSAASSSRGFSDLPEVHSDLYLSFSVKDTGHGLTQSEKALLFNRFSQASPKTHIEYGGSGLGLFISRQITEMLGGEIGMASAPGQGSTFAFYVKAQRIEPPYSAATTPLVQLTRTLSLGADGVPVALPNADGPTPEGMDELTDTGPPRPRLVLVVEDNLVNQKVLCKQLRNRDFTVQAANHGREALDAILASKDANATTHVVDFDVILCDIEMPIMDGIQFTQELRRLEQLGELIGHVPVLGVTANVRSKQVSNAIEAGMDGVTTKPYRIQELIEHMDRICLVR